MTSIKLLQKKKEELIYYLQESRNLGREFEEDYNEIALIFVDDIVAIVRDINSQVSREIKKEKGASENLKNNDLYKETMSLIKEDDLQEVIKCLYFFYIHLKSTIINIQKDEYLIKKIKYFEKYLRNLYK